MSESSVGPLITVGIPTFNRPSGLANTLSRVTGQTYKNLEILVSDNASDDEAAVKQVIEKHQGDQRVKYFRQQKNLGSLGNFRHLVHSASGEYFLWISDDDDVELDYIETLVEKLNQNPDAAIVMGGYDVDDQMSDPPMKLNITSHLFDLMSDTAYGRMKKYVQQPDHLGKSRMHWGMFPTKLISKAFQTCESRIPEGEEPVWFYFPIDLRLLSYGPLAVESRVVWHVKLLASSDGKAHLSGSYKKLMQSADKTVQGMIFAVEDSDLNEGQKEELIGLIKSKARKDKLQLFVYYKVIGSSPRLARLVKVVWYKLFS